MSVLEEQIKEKFVVAVDSAEKGKISLATLSNLYDDVLQAIAEHVIVPRKQLEEMKSDVTLITKYDLIKFLLGDENECVC